MSSRCLLRVAVERRKVGHWRCPTRVHSQRMRLRRRLTRLSRTSTPDYHWRKAEPESSPAQPARTIGTTAQTHSPPGFQTGRTRRVGWGGVDSPVIRDTHRSDEQTATDRKGASQSRDVRRGKTGCTNRDHACGVGPLKSPNPSGKCLRVDSRWFTHHAAGSVTGRKMHAYKGCALPLHPLAATR